VRVAAVTSRPSLARRVERRGRARSSSRELRRQSGAPGAQLRQGGARRWRQPPRPRRCLLASPRSRQRCGHAALLRRAPPPDMVPVVSTSSPVSVTTRCAARPPLYRCRTACEEARGMPGARYCGGALQAPPRTWSMSSATSVSRSARWKAGRMAASRALTRSKRRGPPQAPRRARPCARQRRRRPRPCPG